MVPLCTQGFVFHKDWNPSTYLPFILEVDTCQNQVCSAIPENRKCLNVSLFFPVFHSAQCWQMSDAPFFFSNNYFTQSFAKRTQRPWGKLKKKKKHPPKQLVALYFAAIPEKKIWLLVKFFLQFHICTWKSFFFIIQKNVDIYFFILCSHTLETPWRSSGTDACREHSIIPWQSGKSGLAFMLLTHLHLSALAQVSAAAAAILSFSPTGGLYSGGGVWVWVGQGVVLPTAREGVERVERGEPTDGAWDHGNGVWCHERDIIWWAPHG